MAKQPEYGTFSVNTSDLEPDNFMDRDRSEASLASTVKMGPQ